MRHLRCRWRHSPWRRRRRWREHAYGRGGANNGVLPSRSDCNRISLKEKPSIGKQGEKAKHSSTEKRGEKAKQTGIEKGGAETKQTRLEKRGLQKTMHGASMEKCEPRKIKGASETAWTAKDRVSK